MLVTAPIPLYNVGFSWVGASIRRGAFIRGGRLIQIYYSRGGGGGGVGGFYWIRGVYLRLGVY